MDSFENLMETKKRRINYTKLNFHGASEKFFDVLRSQTYASSDSHKWCNGALWILVSTTIANMNYE